MQFQQSIFKWPIYMEADGRDYKRRYVGNLWSLDDTFVFTISVLPVGEGCSEVPGDKIRGAPSTALVPQPSSSVTNQQLVPAPTIVFSYIPSTALLYRSLPLVLALV